MTPHEFTTATEINGTMIPALFLFIGIPASGKSTFYHRVLKNKNLDYVSLDMLKTRTREWATFEAALAARRSVVVDNTNVTKALRARYLAPAMRFPSSPKHRNG